MQRSIAEIYYIYIYYNYLLLYLLYYILYIHYYLLLNFPLRTEDLHQDYLLSQNPLYYIYYIFIVIYS